MFDYKYHLEKYRGRSTRHECPNCHDPHSFTYYVDEQGRPVDTTVGKCNHEQSCGYHLTPKQWFAVVGGMPQRFFVPVSPRTEPRRPDFIPSEFVKLFFNIGGTLYDFLSEVFTYDRLIETWGDYGIGVSKGGATIFWQIDIGGKVRTGKMIWYGKDGHRIKNGTRPNADWVHSALMRKGLIKKDFTLAQCLFGEHLLTMYPDKPIALVEAEKTAVICSCVNPKFNWLATGGLSQMSIAKMRVLTGRTVSAFPDCKGFEIWNRKAAELRQQGIDIRVCPNVDRWATEREREQGADIADIILRQKQATDPTEVLKIMIAANPSIATLVDKFKLEVRDDRTF